MSLPLAFLALCPQAPTVAPAGALEVPSRWDPAWTLELGRGFGRPVVTDRTVHVLTRLEQAELVALDLATGEVRWRAPFDDGRRDDQESMGGDAPHADPLALGGVVLALGFDGGLQAFDAGDGAPRWSLDLVEDLDATAVQFGFAASPLALDDLAVVAVGTPGPGYVALDPTTGEVRWRSAPYAFSYVTPVLASIDGDRQLVCVTGDETVGLDPADGSELWRVAHVAPGQTNFAPLHVGARGDVYVSGQGARGLRRLDVTRAADGWTAGEAWLARRAQLEQGRAVRAGGRLYGSTSSQLCCVDEASGALAFRLRRFAPCTLTRAGELTALLQEDGALALVRLAPDRIEVFAQRALGGKKCWTAPVVAGERLLVRADGRLFAFDLPPGTGEPLEVIETGGPPAEPAAVEPSGAVIVWTEAQRARVLGDWTIGGAISVSIREAEGDALVATSSAHEGVTFSVAPETLDRAWVRAIDAPYGIPDLRLEAGEAPLRLVFFQSGETFEAVRDGDRPGAPLDR